MEGSERAWMSGMKILEGAGRPESSVERDEWDGMLWRFVDGLRRAEK